jgi:parvulin-like peptidyl-prolyl isomerase
MKQFRITLVCALLPCAVAVAVAGCGGGGLSDDAVATVDGESIDMQSFNHWMAVAVRTSGRPNAQVPKPPDYAACVEQKREAKPTKGETKPTAAQLKAQCRQEYHSLRDQVLSLLVTSRWLEGEAQERGISVSDAEVKAAFERQTKQNFPKAGDYAKFLETSGQTEQDIFTRVRLDLLQGKIRAQVTKGVDRVTDKQVADYYASNKPRFGLSERRDLLVVLTKTKAQAERAKAALAAGRPWPSVVRQYSIDGTSRSQDGKLLGVSEGDQEAALGAAMFKARKGALTGPVKTPFGYYVFEVTNVRPPTQQSLQKAEPTVKQLLASEDQQKALDSFVEDFQKKWRERTECRKEYATPDCKNGPKRPSAPASAPPQPETNR